MSEIGLEPVPNWFCVWQTERFCSDFRQRQNPNCLGMEHFSECPKSERSDFGLDLPRLLTIFRFLRNNRLENGCVIHLFFRQTIFLRRWLAIFLLTSVSSLFVPSVKFEICRKWMFVDGMLFAIISVPEFEIAFLKETVVRWLFLWPVKRMCAIS